MFIIELINAYAADHHTEMPLHDYTGFTIQVSTWCNNYYSSDMNEEHTRRLFRTMQENAKPIGRNTGVKIR